MDLEAYLRNQGANAHVAAVKAAIITELDESDDVPSVKTGGKSRVHVHWYLWRPDSQQITACREALERTGYRLSRFEVTLESHGQRISATVEV
jgi:8-oxo-dGTP pyrophosphatase MutT (NUDIX family)